MQFPERHLSANEQVEYHLRTHIKALLLPDADTGTGAEIGRWVLVGAGVLVVLIWVLWPVLSWLTTTYTVTTERLITRTGVITRTGRDVPAVHVVQLRLSELVRAAHEDDGR